MASSICSRNSFGGSTAGKSSRAALAMASASSNSLRQRSQFFRCGSAAKRSETTSSGSPAWNYWQEMVSESLVIAASAAGGVLAGYCAT